MPTRRDGQIAGGGKTRKTLLRGEQNAASGIPTAMPVRQALQ